jgi:hypothetical protein
MKKPWWRPLHSLIVITLTLAFVINYAVINPVRADGET